MSAINCVGNKGGIDSKFYFGAKGESSVVYLDGYTFKTDDASTDIYLTPDGDGIVFASATKTSGTVSGVINSNNNAVLRLTTGGSSSGDCEIIFSVMYSLDWTLGIDTSNSGNLCLQKAFGLVSNNAIELTHSSNNLLKAHQPRFSVYLGSDLLNVIGSTNDYVVLFDSVLYDPLGDYSSSTGYYTAPTSGKYRISAVVWLRDISAADSTYMYIATSSRTYKFNYKDPSFCKNVDAELGLSGSCVCDLDAGDTVHVGVFFYSEGSNISGIKSVDSIFNGSLIL